MGMEDNRGKLNQLIHKSLLTTLNIGGLPMVDFQSLEFFLEIGHGRL